MARLPLAAKPVNPQLALTKSTSSSRKGDALSPFTALPPKLGLKLRRLRARLSPKKHVDLAFLGPTASDRRKEQFDAARRKLEGRGMPGEQRSDEESDEDTLESIGEAFVGFVKCVLAANCVDGSSLMALLAGLRSSARADLACEGSSGSLGYDSSGRQRIRVDLRIPPPYAHSSTFPATRSYSFSSSLRRPPCVSRGAHSVVALVDFSLVCVDSFFVSAETSILGREPASVPEKKRLTLSS